MTDFDATARMQRCDHCICYWGYNDICCDCGEYPEDRLEATDSDTESVAGEASQ